MSVISRKTVSWAEDENDEKVQEPVDLPNIIDTVSVGVTERNFERITESIMEIFQAYKMTSRKGALDEDSMDPNILCSSYSTFLPQGQKILPQGQKDGLIEKIDSAVLEFFRQIEFAVEALEFTPSYPLKWMDYYKPQKGLKRESTLNLKELKKVMQNCKTSFYDGRDVKCLSVIKCKCRTVLEFLMNAYVPNIDSGKAIYHLNDETLLYQALDARGSSNQPLFEFLAYFLGRCIPLHLSNTLKEKMMLARCVIILQSTGTGKTRLVRMICSYIASFVLTMQLPHAIGHAFPRPDITVVKLFYRMAEKYPGHFIFACFLSSLFRQKLIHIADTHYKNHPDTKINDPRIVYQSRGGDEVITATAEQEMNYVNAMNYMKAVHNLLEKDFDYKKDVLDVLHGLRAGVEQQSKREDFLDKVIDGTLFLLEQCKTRDLSNNDEVGSKDRLLDYIKDSKLEQSINDYFFHVVDEGNLPNSHNVKKDRLSNEEGMTKITQLRQVICCVDECRYAEYIFPTNPNISSRPSELSAIIRVFTDLEECALRKAETMNPDESSRQPLRRVWLFLLDTTANFPTLRPSTVEQKIGMTGRLLHSSRGVASYWYSLGWDWGFRCARLLHPDAMNWLTSDEQQDIKVLRLFGRGMWEAYKIVSDLLELVFKKITGGKDPLQAPLFSLDYKREQADILVDTITYAVASVRFNLDNGIVTNMPAIEFKILSESVQSHLRILHRVNDDNSIETSTPPEPIVQLMCLLIFNFGIDIARNLANGRDVNTIWNLTKTDKVWKNFLKEFIRPCIESRNLVDVGNAGELITRIVTLVARDGCISPQWNVLLNPRAPSFLLSDWLKQLAGQEAQEKIFEKALTLKGCNYEGIDFKYVFMNFNAWTPMYSPVTDADRKLSVNDPLYLRQLIDGWRRQVAYITLPNFPRLDGFFIAKKPKSEAISKLQRQYNTLDLTLEHLGQLMDEEVDFIVIGLDVKWCSTLQPKPLSSPSIVDDDKNQIALTAPLIIRTEMGSDSKYGKDGEVKRFWHCEVATKIEDKKEKSLRMKKEGLEHLPIGEVKSKEQQFVDFRISGFSQESFPCLKIDSDGSFRNAARKTMNARMDQYEEFETDKLMPNSKLPCIRDLKEGKIVDFGTLDLGPFVKKGECSDSQTRVDNFRNYLGLYDKESADNQAESSVSTKRDYVSSSGSSNDTTRPQESFSIDKKRRFE